MRAMELRPPPPQPQPPTLRSLDELVPLTLPALSPKWTLEPDWRGGPWQGLDALWPVTLQWRAALSCAPLSQAKAKMVAMYGTRVADWLESSSCCVKMVWSSRCSTPVTSFRP
jgi:hypothetical protein